ncbi:MAG: hypothetical protein ACE15C_01665 [Phycisphaerae bacterium]
MADLRAIVTVLAIVLAGAVRVAALAVTSEDAFLHDDGTEYRDISRNLAAGRGFAVSFYRWYEPAPPNPPAFHADVYRPPLLPLIGAPLWWVGGQSAPRAWLICAKVAAWVMAMALVLAGIGLAGAVAPGVRWARPLAALALGFHPAVIHYSRMWSSETLFALCILAALWLLVRLPAVARPGRLDERGMGVPPVRPAGVSPAVAAETAARHAGQRPTPQEHGLARPGRMGALCGAAMALCCLARPNGLAFCALIVAALAVLAVGKRRWARAAILPAVLTMAVVLAPWTIRQGITGAGWTPTTAFGPYNFWLGNNARILASYRAADKATFDREQKALYDEDSAQHVAKMQRDGLFDPRQTGREWTALAMDWLREHPSDAAAIWAYRLWHFVRPWPTVFIMPAWQAAVLGIVNGLTFVLAAWWFIRRGVSWSTGAPVLLCVAANLAAALPFVFHQRFRFPMTEVPLIVLAACAVAMIVTTEQTSR